MISDHAQIYFSLCTDISKGVGVGITSQLSAYNSDPPIRWLTLVSVECCLEYYSRDPPEHEMQALCPFCPMQGIVS